MSFGLVVIDDEGRVWTVDLVRPSALRFSRPNFLEPIEERCVEPAPECWPSCRAETLRTYLQVATPCTPPE
jgi:hypothetical protein